METCGSDDSTQPIATSQSTNTTSNATATAASTAPAADPTTAPTTVPSVARVTMDLEPSPDFEVLYEAGVGSAQDQLRLEDCNECDPTGR